MSIFTEDELSYLRGERRLGRLATVGPDGMPHVAPVRWSYDPESDVVEVGGHEFAATKKYRDVQRTGRAALVVDDVLAPWQPRGVEIRGDAAAVPEPDPHIRIRPTRIVAWGLSEAGGRSTRTVS